ncbi:hypothetical protein ACIGDI_40095 [Streptomyces sp. NPDC085900]|uniref:hypothetical protein n=1 Tax=Streptomyces sp. NPDC085900 TaxID=3365737 RepID=UPI0037D363C1
MKTKKRQMWEQVCYLFVVIWLLLAVFVAWPFVFLALFSGLAVMIPVGIPEDEKASPEPDPDSWRTDKRRPWQ